jgi:hypothetical protein
MRSNLSGGALLPQLPTGCRYTRLKYFVADSPIGHLSLPLDYISCMDAMYRAHYNPHIFPGYLDSLGRYQHPRARIMYATLKAPMPKNLRFLLLPSSRSLRHGNIHAAIIVVTSLRPWWRRQDEFIRMESSHKSLRRDAKDNAGQARGEEINHGDISTSVLSVVM